MAPKVQTLDEVKSNPTLFIQEFGYSHCKRCKSRRLYARYVSKGNPGSATVICIGCEHREKEVNKGVEDLESSYAEDE